MATWYTSTEEFYNIKKYCNNLYGATNYWYTTYDTYNDALSFLDSKKKTLTIESIFQDPNKFLKGQNYKRVLNQITENVFEQEYVHVSEFDIETMAVTYSYFKVTPFATNCIISSNKTVSLDEFEKFIHSNKYSLCDDSTFNYIISSNCISSRNYNSIVIKCGKPYTELALLTYAKKMNVNICLSSYWYNPTERKNLEDENKIAILRPNGEFYFLPEEMYNDVKQYHKEFTFSVEDKNFETKDFVHFILRELKKTRSFYYSKCRKHFETYHYNESFEEFIDKSIKHIRNENDNFFDLNDISKVVSVLRSTFISEPPVIRYDFSLTWDIIEENIYSSYITYEIQ